MSAREQALAAYAKQRQAERDAGREQRLYEEREHSRQVSLTLAAALPTLQDWFPGVHWDVFDSKCGRCGSAAGYGHGQEIVVHEALNLDRAPLFFLIERRPPPCNYVIHLVTKEYDTDTCYSYWTGPLVRSVEEVGKVLAG